MIYHVLIFFLLSNKVQRECAEPEPEEIEQGHVFPPNDNPIESFAYRSGVGAPPVGNIPNFLPDSFVNAKILKTGLKQQLLTYKPSNTPANAGEELESDESSIEFRPDSVAPSSEFITDLDPTADWELGLTSNPLYPLQVPRLETFEKNIGESTCNSEVPTAQDSDRSFANSSVEHSTNESEDEDELDRSLEIPVTHIHPTFTEEDSLDDILESLNVNYWKEVKSCW